MRFYVVGFDLNRSLLGTRPKNIFVRLVGTKITAWSSKNDQKMTNWIMNWSKTINSYQIIEIKKNQEIKNSGQIIIDIVICWYTTIKFLKDSSDRLGNGGQTEANGNDWA